MANGWGTSKLNWLPNVTLDHRSQRLGDVFQRLRPHLSRVGWSALEAVINPILSIAVSPALLALLDSRGFGLWAFALAVSGFGGLASLGVGVAATKFVAESHASGAPKAAIATTRAALTVALGGGAVLVALGLLFGQLLASTAFARMGASGEVSAALLLGIAILALQEVDSVFTGALRGMQCFARSAQVEIGARVFWLVVVISAAWWTRDAVDTLIASCAVIALKVLAKGLAAQHALAGPCLVPSLSRADLLRIVQFGKWVSLQSIGGLLFSVVDRLAVGAIFGAADLARYSICMQLAQLVHSVQAVVWQPLVPWMSSRVASDRPAEPALLIRIALVGGLGCMVVPLAIIAGAQIFLSLWINVDFANRNLEIARILLMSYGLLAFNIPGHYLLLGKGQVRFLAATNLLAGFVSLTASLLMSPWGLVEFVIGKLLFAPLILFNFAALRRPPASRERPIVSK